MNFGTLFVVATPIGNLDDITFRALETLKTVDIVLCEDTRVTANLLSRYEIKTTTKSYHQHSTPTVVAEIIALLEEGRNLALVTDAGTPGISDPGNELIAELVANHKDISIVPIPGVSAVVTAMSISGFRSDKFLFLGFPPQKNKRKKFFEEVAASEHTTVFYESNYRILKAIENMKETLEPTRQVVICRELTKKFETIYRGTMEEIGQMDIKEKGEFVIVVEGKRSV